MISGSVSQKFWFIIIKMILIHKNVIKGSPKKLKLRKENFKIITKKIN